MVSYTIKNTNGVRGELLTHAGLALALLLAGVPQAFSAVVAIGGLSLAAKSWKDMMWINDTKNDESTAMLFPGDTIQHVVGGLGPWENDYDIVTVRNHIEEHTNTSGTKSYTFQVTMHSITNAAYEEWTVKRIRDSGKPTQARRLLFIDSLKPSGSANPSKKPPFALEEDSILSYNTAFKFGQGIYDCWYSNSYWGEQSDTILEADGDKEIAIVQGPDSHFKPTGYNSPGYHVHHFHEDPFTPVLEITRCDIDVGSSERGTARRLIGRTDGTAGAVKLIQKNEQTDKNTWAYHLDRLDRGVYDLYAWTWRKSSKISKSSGDSVFFIVRKWLPGTAIAKKSD